MLSPITCRCWPTERLKRRKYLMNDKKTTHKALWTMTFKPFSPNKYLFIMTLAVSIELCEKVNLFKPNTPQRQTHRFKSRSPYCPAASLNGPRAYIRIPLYIQPPNKLKVASWRIKLEETQLPLAVTQQYSVFGLSLQKFACQNFCNFLSCRCLRHC